MTNGHGHLGFDAHQPPPPDNGGAGPSRTPIVLAVVAVIGGLAVLGMGYLLLFGGSDEPEVLAYRNRPPKGTPYYDGLVTNASATRFEIKTRTASKTLTVRPEDEPFLDVAHAQQHSALGQPLRVYYRSVDDRKVVIYMEDSPVVFDR